MAAWKRPACRWLLAALLAGAAAAANAREYSVVVSAPHRAYHETPVIVAVEAPPEFDTVAVWRDGERVPAQARRDGQRAEVTWIVRDLKQGDAVPYRLTFGKQMPGSTASGVTIHRSGENLEIRVNNELFTRYDTTTGPNKPYFYPLIGPGGRRITRRYPLETAPVESHDHPHHRGLWFTHGAVNGEDYWAEGPKTAKTLHRKYERIESGPVYGAFRALTDWIGRDGKKVCEDARDVRIYDTAAGRLIDFDITIRPTSGPVTFGDTKEGAFGIRLTDSMRVKGGGGHIETPAGVKDADAWGKRAEWVDYYGPVDGATVGIAILDYPQNLRHPTWWHVRDYGLFAVNPFGLHDFEKGQPAGAGDYTIPAGGALTFRYRLYLHSGSTAQARVADAWTAYADPPSVAVRREHE